MAAVIYTLCALTCLASALLLLRAYARTKVKLLFWSGLCFVGLTASNVILVADRIFLPDVDLTTARLATALVAVLLMVFGLVWESD